MSSHHIVRDEQEPALLLWQPGQITFEQAGELLEWSPRVVVHQPALEEALAWGIKLDAVWAAPQAVAAASAAVEHQQPVSVLPLPAQHALPGILHWLKDMQQTSLHLVANAAADNFLLLQELEPLQQLVQMQLISQGWRYSFYKSGRAQKWLPAGSRLRVISFNKQPSVAGVATKPINAHASIPEIELLQSGIVQLMADAPFWIGEAL